VIFRESIGFIFLAREEGGLLAVERYSYSGSPKYRMILNFFLFLPLLQKHSFFFIAFSLCLASLLLGLSFSCLNSMMCITIHPSSL
jgi:hypothetical protein